MNYEHYKAIKKYADENDLAGWEKYKKQQEENNNPIDLSFANLRNLNLNAFNLDNTNIQFVDVSGSSFNYASVKNNLSF